MKKYERLENICTEVIKVNMIRIAVFNGRL